MGRIQNLLKKDTLASKNIIWLLFDHLITFIGGLFIGIWVARVLGPADFGLYSYALALFAIFGSIAQMGLASLAVRDIVESDEVGLSISTIGIIKFVGSLLSFCVLLLFLFFDSGSWTQIQLTLIVGTGILLTPLSIIDSYFDSQVQSSRKVIARKTGYVARSVLLIVCILLDLPLYYLGIAVLSEHIIAASILVYFFKKESILQGFQFSRNKARSLLSESWPLVVSSLGAMLYLKIDQVMVVSMLGDVAGGHYGAAVRYTSIFFFLHTILITTYFPRLITSKKVSESLYVRDITKISSALVFLSLVVIIGTHFFIKQFVGISFGPEYFPAVSIIKLHIWSLPLVFFGAILSKWLIIERLTMFSMARHGAGLIVNIVLNVILIPKYGAEGAAVASIAALFFSSIVILLFHPRLRALLLIFMKSLYLPFTIRSI